MALWLSEQGHDVRVICSPPYYPEWKVRSGYSSWWYRREILGSLHVIRCPLWVPARPSGIKRILHLASFALSSLPVVVSQVLWRPHVVICVEPPLLNSFSAFILSILSGAKSILHIQDFEVDAAFDMGLLRSQWLHRTILAVERWLLRRFDKVSTISGRMLQRLESKGVAEESRLFFPNWVNTDLIQPMLTPGRFREELGIPANEVVLLYSGNMGQKQGLELIIESARKLVTDSRVRFVMCGQGAAYESLRNMAAGLQNIIWIPLQPQERLNDLLNLADVHLLPQRADAADLVMPSKLTGILASGRPVIATAAEGTEVWSVVDGRGINTPPGDVGAFVAAILRLVDDPDERLRLGQNGRKHAVDNLSTDAVLGKFESELLQLTGNTKQ
jgi:colanic acid biosynthesis glycosyl transferase WcaI